MLMLQLNDSEIRPKNIMIYFDLRRLPNAPMYNISKLSTSVIKFFKNGVIIIHKIVNNSYVNIA